MHNEDHSGQPSLVTPELMENVQKALLQNWCFTISELSGQFHQMSCSLLHEIVSRWLGFWKVCAKWVSKQLTEEHKTKYLVAALTFLQRYAEKGDEFLNNVVTGDETWVSHATPETKPQSMHWRHSGSSVKTKFKLTISVKRIMCTVFWD